MDWSKIKTLFILTFFVLDIFLMYQFLKNRDANAHKFMTETSFEEKLAADDIQYVELPKGPIKETFVSARPKLFNEDELPKSAGKKISVTDGTTVQAVLEKPIKISGKFEPSELSSYLKANILNGDQYQYWETNSEENTITYYQKFQDKVLFNNINGRLTFYLNKDNEIISYKQTLLEKIEENSESEEVLPPVKAIETLYEKGLLKPKSKITKVELGYFTLVQLTASQVLTPTWRFVIDDKENLFVNAFEGQIIQLDNEENKIVE